MTTTAGLRAGPVGLTGAERRATAASILAAQQASGLITWYPGGHGDPWNHVEAAMALDTAGEAAAAEAAYEWLARAQDARGALASSYHPDGSVREARVDTNAAVYLALGLYHHSLCLGDYAFARRHRETLRRAVSFVLAHQLPSGPIAWAVSPEGTPAGTGLLAASSAVHLALSAAAALASPCGLDASWWRRGRHRLRGAIAAGGPGFADKSEFAMDWYYPALSGALPAAAGRARLHRGAPVFVRPGAGVLCRRDRRWVTSAETAECVLAHLCVGEEAAAGGLFATLSDKRRPDGAYLTGLVHPEAVAYPGGEVTTYSAAAVLLADDALGGGPTLAAFAVGAPRGRRRQRSGLVARR